VGGRRVPKGWRVQLMLGQAQKDIQEFSEDSEAFRPERCALHAKRQGVVLDGRHAAQMRVHGKLECIWLLLCMGSKGHELLLGLSSWFALLNIVALTKCQFLVHQPC